LTPFLTLQAASGDHEVDLIVERRDQCVVALEVKLDGVPGPAEVRHLLWLRQQFQLAPPPSKNALRLAT